MAVESTSGAPASSTPPQGQASKPARGGVAGGLLKRLLTLREGSIIVVTLITLIYFSATTSAFFSVGSFKALLPYFCPLAILAAGQVFVMTTGEIDLSIGAVYLISPFIFDKIVGLGIPLIPSLILTLLIVMVLGAINGLFVAYVGIASFVATLGMLFVLDGATLVMSHSTPITMPGTSILTKTTFARFFGAGLGARDRDRPPGGALVLPMGSLHRRSGRKPARRGGSGRQRQACPRTQLHRVRHDGRLRRDSRGGARVDRDPGPVRLQPDPVAGGRSGDHRGHADDRRRGNRGRRPDRRAVPRHSDRGPDDQGRQR